MFFKDKSYLFEDINFSTQDEEKKERTGAKFETLLRSMNVSYKIIVSNHYADNNRLREAILHKAVDESMEPLAFSFQWDEYFNLRRDWRNDIINTSIREHRDHMELDGGKYACAMFVRKYPNGLSDQFLSEITNLPFPLIYTT